MSTRSAARGAGSVLRPVRATCSRMSAEVNSKGYPVAWMVNPDACTGCASCAVICPDSCHYGLSSKIRVSYGRERGKTDERQRSDRPCGDSLRLRRIFRIPDHSPVGGDGDPDGTQTVGDHGHGRAAGRVGDLFDQHGLRRRIDRKTGDDLLVQPRHQPDVRGAELPGGRRAALPDRSTASAAARGWVRSSLRRATISRPAKAAATAIST